MVQTMALIEGLIVVVVAKFDLVVAFVGAFVVCCLPFPT